MNIINKPGVIIFLFLSLHFSVFSMDSGVAKFRTPEPTSSFSQDMLEAGKDLAIGYVLMSVFYGISDVENISDNVIVGGALWIGQNSLHLMALEYIVSGCGKAISGCCKKVRHLYDGSDYPKAKNKSRKKMHHYTPDADRTQIIDDNSSNKDIAWKNYFFVALDLLSPVIIGVQVYVTLFDEESVVTLLPTVAALRGQDLFGDVYGFNSPGAALDVLGASASLINLGWFLFERTHDEVAEVPLRGFLRAMATTTNVQYLKWLPYNLYVYNYVNNNKRDLTWEASAFTALNDAPPLMFCLALRHFSRGIGQLYDNKRRLYNIEDELASDLIDVVAVPRPRHRFKPTVRPAPMPSTSTVVSMITDNDGKSDGSYKPDQAEVEPLPKRKVKRKGIAHLNAAGIGNLEAVTIDQDDESIDPRDKTRMEYFEKIESLRGKHNNPSKADMLALYSAAIKFVGGGYRIDGNKIFVFWKRKGIDRSVHFELPHKQKNEKGNVFKGNKKHAALDGLEIMFLDGWTKEKILEQLGDRSKLKILPFEWISILWTYSEDE